MKTQDMKKLRSTEERIMPGDKWTYQLLQASISRYVFASHFVEGKSVFDLGCGNGYGANYLKNKGVKEVIDCDYSQEAISYAKSAYPVDGLSFVQADVQQLQFDDSRFDVVIALEILEHLEQWQNFVAECNRVLNNGGVFICSTPDKEVTSFNQEPLSTYHVKECYKDEFHDLMSKHFNEVLLYGIEPQDEKDRTLQGLVVRFKLKIFCLLKAEKIINFVTKFIFRKYRLIKLEEIDKDFEKVLDKRYAPYLLQDGTLPPGTIIGVGKKAKD